MEKIQSILIKMMPYWLIKKSPKCQEILWRIALGDSQNLWNKIKEIYHFLYCTACYRFKICSKKIEMAAKKTQNNITDNELIDLNNKSKKLLDESLKE